MAAVPSLERLEQVTTNAVGGDGGNAWGNNKLRIVRTSTGDVFTAYPAAGTDSVHKRWVLMHRPPNGGWTQDASGIGGREPPNVLLSPNDRVSLLTWPNGAATLVNDAGPDGQTPFTARSIPTGWPAENWPYAGAAVRPGQGDEFIIRNYAPYDTHTVQYYATRRAGSSTWTTGSFNLRYQYAYPQVMIDGNHGVYVVEVRGSKWSSMGYNRPPGAFDYVYDRVSYWYSPDPSRSSFGDEFVVHQEPQQSGTRDYVYTFAQDAYLDNQSRLHVLYETQGPGGQGFLAFHAIIQNGKLLKDLALPDTFWGGDTVRIIQDTSGRFYYVTWINSTIVVYPADSNDGTEIGPPTLLDISPHTPDTWLWLATPRGGEPLTDYVDGVFSSERETGLVYFRVQLK